MAAPFGPLHYLYVGSKDTAADVRYYVDKLGAELVWDYKEFGAHVAAVRLGAGPLFLLADHRPPASVIFIYDVEDLRATRRELEKRGWSAQGEPFEVPDGPVLTFKDPTGNEIGLLQPDRSGVLEHEFKGEKKPRAR